MSIRNRPGLADVRDRYIRRAKYLLRDDAEYRGSIDHARDSWGLAFPRYRISPRPIGEEINLLPPDAVIPPPALQDDGVANHRRMVNALARGDSLQNDRLDLTSCSEMAWIKEVRAIADRFWPSEDFPNISVWSDVDLLNSHPACRFVSTCLLFTRDSLTDVVIARLFPICRLQIRSLPYRPSWNGEAMLAQVEAERDVLWKEVGRLISDQQPEEQRREFVEKLEQQVLEAKRQAFLSVQRRRPIERWSFLPVVPGMSVNDVEAVASQLAGLSARVYGANEVDRRVRDLLDSGMTQKEVANRLGRSERFVRESAWRTRRR